MDSLLKDLTPDEEKEVREYFSNWREQTLAEMNEQVEEAKSQKIQELEEANLEFVEKLKDDYAVKFVKALDEMKSVLRAEIVAEMVETNPELQILERIKELVAPTLNEEYVSNIYAEEIATLREKNAILERNAELEEGARTLAELLTPYSAKAREVALSLIKEGNPEEVTEQFYGIVDGLNLFEKEEDETEDDDTDEEGEDEGDEKPKKEDFDTEEEFKAALKKWEADNKDDDDDSEEDETEEDEDEKKNESFIDDKKSLNESNKSSKTTSLKEEMKRLSARRK